MKIFEKIKINIVNEKLRRVKFLGITLYEYGNKKNKKFFRPAIFKLFQKKEACFNKQNPVFYLKVNRDIKDTFICLQYWIDIAAETNSDFYIVCDNKDLKLKILENIKFKNENIKFIKSKVKPFFKTVKKQKLHKCWYRAAFAHLTVFWHIKKHKIQNCWNIDADDALFLTNTKNAIKILNTAQDYVHQNNLNALSFDFWATKTQNRHWSFGITYIQNNKDYFKDLKENIINWEEYKDRTSVHNIDWIFSFLKNKGILKLETFYVENLYFMHWGRFFGDMKNAFIVTWNNGEMLYPIWYSIFHDTRGKHTIPKNIVKFDLGINKEDCLDFAMKYLANLKRMPLENVCEQ